MFVTSKTLQSFTKRLTREAMAILKDEFGIPTYRQRFERHGKLYPLTLVLFEHPRTLGFFEPRYLQIGINKSLSYRSNQDFLLNLLRHELIHYLAMIDYGLDISPHGPEFHELCRFFKLGPEVSSATIEESEVDLLKTQDERGKLLQKVQKLLKLGESQNIHEASQATLKANELLIKYNLSDINESAIEEEKEIFRQRALKFKKRNAKTDAIVDILKQCQVEALYAVGHGETSIEIIGERENVEICDYLAKFLDNELEELLNKERQVNRALKGLRARNSFFNGVAKGFSMALKKQNLDVMGARAVNSLVQLREHQVAMFYPRLRGVTQKTKLDSEALRAGTRAGEKLSLRPGIRPAQGPRLLGYNQG